MICSAHCRASSVFLSGLLLATCPNLATASLVVKVSKAVSVLSPVAVPSFGSGPTAQPSLAQVVRYDLSNSGYFRVLPPGLYPGDPHDARRLALTSWEDIGAQTLVFGSILHRPGSYTVSAYLVNLLDPSAYSGERFIANRYAFHRIGNQIANLAYRHVTHHEGPFSGHLAFVDQLGQNYDLEVSGCEGWDPRVVVRGKIPIISPAWSPGDHHLAYVSYRHQHSVIYIQNLQTGHRVLLPGHGYALSAPAYSPNGHYLAFARAKHGRTQIAVENLRTGRVQMLASIGTVNTSPVWSPDGRHIFFVSNRDGSAQIFRMDRSGTNVHRVTWSGGYNVSPAISPNGKWLAFVHADNGILSVAIMHQDGTGLRVLYSATNCERPSFAPDSRMVLFNTTRGGRKVLGQVAINGRGLHFLHIPGQTKEGSWDYI